MTCPDRPGLVAKVANYVSDYEGNLTEFQQFVDREQAKFFCRLEIDITKLSVDVEDFKNGFSTLARALGAEWHSRKLPYLMRTAVLVTKTDHCLNEILWRTRIKELPLEISSVIGNQNTCRPVAEKENLPFHHINMEANAEKGFREIANLLEQQHIELIVLARFMRILPDWFCEQYAGRIINIHHSFLPAFIGANPYRKAYQRGVKLIGATCHYVTKELDDGPIIEQEVQRVEHTHGVRDLIRMGRDCERTALAQGIRYHVHDRTIIDGNRAIVFRD